MKNTESAPVRQPDRVLSYFENQRPVLAVVTVSGLIYNLGLVVGPGLRASWLNACWAF